MLLRGGQKKLVRTLQPNGNCHTTRLDKTFFKDKFTDDLVVIRSAEDAIAGNACVTTLNAGLAPVGRPLGERNVKQRCCSSWKPCAGRVPRGAELDDRARVETQLRQPLGTLLGGDVSHQLRNGSEILPALRLREARGPVHFWTATLYSDLRMKHSLGNSAVSRIGMWSRCAGGPLRPDGRGL